MAIWNYVVDVSQFLNTLDICFNMVKIWDSPTFLLSIKPFFTQKQKDFKDKLVYF